jgi:hypothetical protein
MVEVNMKSLPARKILSAVAAASIAAAATQPAAGAEPILSARWDGSAGNVFAPGTPDHPGHVDADADGGGFYRLDRVEDGSSGIRARLDIADTQARWLEISFEIRGEDARGIAGLGYRLLGDDPRVALSSEFDYPPCPKQREAWTQCRTYVPVPRAARTLDVFLSAPFGSNLDVRSVEVSTVLRELLQPASDGTAAEIERIFGEFRSRYFRADAVDWAQVRNTCEREAFPQTYDPSVPFAKCLVRNLPDSTHSRVYRKAATPAGSGVAPRPNEVRVLDSGVGYMRLATAAVEPGEESDRYARTTGSAISTLLSRNVSRWIVDLRGNGGGNVYAMLAAVAPLVGPDRKPLAYWEHAGGAKTPVRLTSEGAQEGGTVRAAVSGLQQPPKQTRVVVLLDKGCVSSCEILAMILESRKYVTLIGERTGGLNTSNDELDLSDPYKVALTTAYVNDALGRRRYPDIVPAIAHSGGDASWIYAAESLLTR